MLKSLNQRELINLSRSIVQPLNPSFHKGQAGRIAVIGGCEDYTGAPFFSASSASLLGADLCHVICEKMAAPVIKSYSPDLMVHPYLFDMSNPKVTEHFGKDKAANLAKLNIQDILKSHREIDDFIDEIVLPKVVSILERTEIAVIGPGFGRDPLMMKTLVRIIEQVKVLNKSVILDADALYLLSVYPNIIHGYSKAYITPNVAELDRLAKKLEIPSSMKEKDIGKLIDISTSLSQKMGNVTVILKNYRDIVARGCSHLLIDIDGSPRRVGGQGDTLTGALATYINWSDHYNDGVFSEPSGSAKLTPDESNMLACYAACATVRFAASRTFDQYGRSMQTSNLHQLLGTAFSDLFENEIYLNKI